MKDWLEHKVSGLVSAAVTALVTWISTKVHLGLTPDQCFHLGLMVTGGLFTHGAVNSHADRIAEAKSDAKPAGAP